MTRCLGQPLGEVGPFPARGAQSCGAWGRALVWEPGERPSPWSLLCLAPRKSLPVTSSVNWGEEDNAPSRNICSHVCEHLAERLVGIMHSACDHYLMLIKMISVLILYIGIQPFRIFRNLKSHLDQCFSNFQVQQNDLVTKKTRTQCPGPLLDFLVEVDIASLIITSSQGTSQVWLHWSPGLRQSPSPFGPVLAEWWPLCPELSPGGSALRFRCGKSRSPLSLGLDASSSDRAALCLHLSQGTSADP